MKTLFINVKELVQVRDSSVRKISGENMRELPILRKAFLLIENQRIQDFGLMSDLPDLNLDQKIDATGKIILPSWCDSHTHLVFATTREEEFVDRINGLTYEEIASKGGGILNSAKKLQNCSEDELYEAAVLRLKEVIMLGTGAIEIKSGYGLSVNDELKMLRVIKRLKQYFSIPIKATFLGAHAFPKVFKENRQGYIDLIIKKMLPEITEENLAD